MQSPFFLPFFVPVRSAIFVFAWVVGAMLVVPMAGRAATSTYPGAAPCNTTLQACIDAASSNDTIELAFNTANAESLTIQNKNLTVQPKAGNTPKVGSVLIMADTAAATVVVQRLAGIGRVDAFCGKADLDVSVLSSNFTPGSTMTVRDNPGYSTGRITATIAHNTFNIADVDNGSSAISVTVFTQPFTATIVDNDMSLTNLRQDGGIMVYLGAGNGSSATIDRNRLFGSNFDFGIQLRTAGGNDNAAPPSLLNASVTNNVVTGQYGNVGAPGGIVLSASGWNGTIDAKIVNNTLVDGRTGILASARDDMGSAIRVVVGNNLIAYNQSYAIGIDPSAVRTLSNNLVFSNGPDYDGPLPGTIVADPLFVNHATKIYTLGPGSPAVDRGLDAALPPQFNLDVVGNPRRVGTLDIGAFESAAIAAAVAGVCGSDNGRSLDATPTQLCNVGIASPIIGNGLPWTWSCVGTGANATANCSAQRAPATAPATSPALLALFCGLLIACGLRTRRA